MKFHERSKKESKQRHYTDAGEETEQDEKTSHPAEEGSTAHLPAFGGPVFILGPPWGFGTGVMGVGHWLMALLRAAYYVLRNSKYEVRNTQ